MGQWSVVRQMRIDNYRFMIINSGFARNSNKVSLTLTIPGR